VALAADEKSLAAAFCRGPAFGASTARYPGVPVEDQFGVEDVVAHLDDPHLFQRRPNEVRM
jgi:hypothetical protein